LKDPREAQIFFVLSQRRVAENGGRFVVLNQQRVAVMMNDVTARYYTSISAPLQLKCRVWQKGIPVISMS
jgi:hypothetical protein